MVNAEVTIAARDEQIGLFDVRDDGECRAGRQVAFEFVHHVALAFGHDFDAAIGQVAHGAQHLMPGGGPHGEIAIAYAMHRTGDDETTRDHKCDEWFERGVKLAVRCGEVNLPNDHQDRHAQHVARSRLLNAAKVFYVLGY